MSSILLSLAFLAVPLSAFAVPESQFNTIEEFLKENVQGVTVETEAEGDSYDEKHIVKFRRMLTFGKVKTQGRSLAMDLTAQVERSNFRKNAEGKAGELAFTDKSRLVRRLELSERVSTGKVVGFVRTLSVDGEKIFGDADAVVGNFNAKTQQLVLDDANIGYVDDTMDGTTFTPIARTAETTLYLDDRGMLVVDQTLQTHVVEPSTLAKELKATHEISSKQVSGLPKLFTK